MWSTILKPYWLVTTLRETPAKTAYSLLILSLMIIGFIALVTFQMVLINIKQPISVSVRVYAVILLLFSYAIFTYLLLKVCQKESRFLQTFCSLLGAYIIIHLFAMPLVWLSYAVTTQQVSLDFIFYLNIIYLIATLILTIWQFAAIAHIYRSALDMSFSRGVLASFGLMAFNLLIFSLIQ